MQASKLFVSPKTKSQRALSKMVSQSKFNYVASSACSTFVHPWSNHCFEGILKMFFSSLQGSFKIFLVVYSVKVLLMGKHVSMEKVLTTLRALLSSTIFGAVTATGFVAYNCMLRKLLGKFKYITLGLVPGILTGFGIFIENSSNRKLLVSNFLQMTIELNLFHLKALRIFILTKKNATLIFMICNAFIMYFIRKYPKIDAGHWFYNQSVQGMRQRSEQIGLQNLMLDGIKFLTIGFGLSFFRKLLGNIHLQQHLEGNALSALQNPSSYTMGIFLGMYVIINQGTSSLLERMFRKTKKSLRNDIFAGLASGASSWILQPNTSLVSSAISSVLLILCKLMSEKNPMIFKYHREFIYIICSGLIFQARALQEESCPKIIKEIMQKATNGRSDEMANHLISAVNKKAY